MLTQKRLSSFKPSLFVLLTFGGGGQLIAQEPEPRNLVSIGGGAAVPGGDLRYYMSTSALIRLNYAYRFHRNLQAEAGLDVHFGAANVDRMEQSPLGKIRITDSEYVVPFGLRAILPLAHDRLELSAGGGGAYLFYSEEAGQPEGINFYCPYGPCYVTVDCETCKSRNGWGYYGIGGASFALDARRRFWLAVTARYTRATTAGSFFTTASGSRTKDQWLSTAVEFGVRF